VHGGQGKDGNGPTNGCEGNNYKEEGRCWLRIESETVPVYLFDLVLCLSVIMTLYCVWLFYVCVDVCM
jgi:hypothetical protein